MPTHFVRLLRLPEEIRRRYDVSSLRLVCHGAAPVSVEVKRQMIDWWGPVLCEFYGATEGGGVMIDAHDWLRKPGSVGKPRPGLAMKIIDDDGNEVPTGTEGTICFGAEAANPWQYKGDADKTSESQPIEGFYTMGDVGYVDDDGFLYLGGNSGSDDFPTTPGVLQPSHHPEATRLARVRTLDFLDSHIAGA